MIDLIMCRILTQKSLNAPKVELEEKDRDVEY